MKTPQLVWGFFIGAMIELMLLLITFVALALAVLGYMTAWFVLARWSGRTDVIDIAWGLGFVYVALVAWLLQDRPSGVPLLSLCFVAVWGVRLAWHIGSRNIAKPTDDYRYLEFRKKWGVQYWPQAYVRIFLLQGLLILIIGSSAIASILPADSSVRSLVIAGYMIWGFGIVFETLADWQLRRFVAIKKPGEIMQAGLWRYSRHPNYFGEITAWWGAAIVAVAIGQWWGIIGAAVITLLITKISGIPPIEKHYADNPAFQKYKRQTSALIPLPPR